MYSERTVWFLLQYLAFSVANLSVRLVFRLKTTEMEEMNEFFCKKDRENLHVSLLKKLYSAAEQCHII